MQAIALSWQHVRRSRHYRCSAISGHKYRPGLLAEIAMLCEDQTDLDIALAHRAGT